MRLTAMSYNLLRVFEETSKIQAPDLIYPSDKKYRKALEKRQRAAEKRGELCESIIFSGKNSPYKFIHYSGSSKRNNNRKVSAELYEGLDGSIGSKAVSNRGTLMRNIALGWCFSFGH